MRPAPSLPLLLEVGCSHICNRLVMAINAFGYLGQLCCEQGFLTEGVPLSPVQSLSTGRTARNDDLSTTSTLPLPADKEQSTHAPTVLPDPSARLPGASPRLPDECWLVSRMVWSCLRRVATHQGHVAAHPDHNADPCVTSQRTSCNDTMQALEEYHAS